MLSQVLYRYTKKRRAAGSFLHTAPFRACDSVIRLCRGMSSSTRIIPF